MDIALVKNITVRVLMENKLRGKFITLEGMDGSGKTTMTTVLVKKLEELGFKVIQTREPGGTPLGEKIRSLLLSENLGALTDIYLHNASRAHHIQEVIRPKLDEGYVVVTDRFIDSTLAYQGFGKGALDLVKSFNAITARGLEIDYTLFFNISLEESLKRLASRYDEANYLDTLDLEFKERVFAGYRYAFDMNIERMYNVDANQSLDEVKLSVENWAEQVFYRNNKDLLG